MSGMATREDGSELSEVSGAPGRATARADRLDRLVTTLTHRRRLLADAARGEALREALAHTSRESGLALWIVTTTGRVLAGDAPLDPSHVDAITVEALSAQRLPVVAVPQPAPAAGSPVA